ncbi:hypothetical protein V2J09_009664 [Rumex salicifolius]
MEVQALPSESSFISSPPSLSAMVTTPAPNQDKVYQPPEYNQNGGFDEMSPVPGVDLKMSARNGHSSETAVVRMQKVYRSYRTRRRLADSAVVAEELWWQAIDYARLNHSTVSFFSLPTPETAASRWSRVTLNASKVGKGLGRDSKAQTLAFQHWIEAIDPRHRYGHNLHKYYHLWCETNSGQPFFYWLDVGDGKEIEHDECSRSKLRDQCVKYLGPQEREHYEYIVEDGKIVYKMTEEPLHTGSKSKWIFVMSASEKLYIGEKKKGKFHHSSFLAGGTTLAAGRLTSEFGVLKSISAYSGHYRPTDDKLDSLMTYLKNHGVKLEEVLIEKPTDDSPENYDCKSTKITTEVSDSQPEAGASAGTETLEEPIEGNYRRSLSGGIKSPRADVPKEAIMERINSIGEGKSYQLGKQLQRKWSTGAGPRIGCIADYPVELRFKALEFTELSPRWRPPTPSPFKRNAGLGSPLGSPRESDTLSGSQQKDL